jgi:hypothetical protein
VAVASVIREGLLWLWLNRPLPEDAGYLRASARHEYVARMSRAHRRNDGFVTAEKS